MVTLAPSRTPKVEDSTIEKIEVKLTHCENNLPKLFHLDIEGLFTLK